MPLYQGKKRGGPRSGLPVKTASCWGEKEALKGCLEVMLGHGLGVVCLSPSHSTFPPFNEFIC